MRSTAYDWQIWPTLLAHLGLLSCFYPATITPPPSGKELTTVADLRIWVRKIKHQLMLANKLRTCPCSPRCRATVVLIVVSRGFLPCQKSSILPQQTEARHCFRAVRNRILPLQKRNPRIASVSLNSVPSHILVTAKSTRRWYYKTFWVRKRVTRSRKWNLTSDSAFSPGRPDTLSTKLSKKQKT